MRLLFGSDDYICQWVAVRTGASITNGKAIGVIDGDRLIGAVAYSNWRGCDVEMLCAAESKKWMSRGNLRAFFHYPFEQLGCLRVTAIVDKKNKKSRRFVEKVGFKLEGVHPRALEGRDACSYGMLKRHCKWLRKDNGKEIGAVRTATA